MYGHSEIEPYSLYTALLMDKSVLSVPYELFAVFFYHNPLIKKFLNIKSTQIP